MLKPLVFGEQGEAAIVSFDHRIQLLQDFTNDPDLLAEGLRKLRAGSSSSRLIDAWMKACACCGAVRATAAG